MDLDNDGTVTLEEMKKWWCCRRKISTWYGKRWSGAFHQLKFHPWSRDLRLREVAAKAG